MKRIYTVIVLLLMISQLLFLPLSLSIANANELPIHIEENKKENKIVLSSDIMTAEFEGQNPKVKFYFTQLAEDSENYSLSFFLNFKKLVEFHDEDGNGVYEHGIDEIVRMIEIERLKWTPTPFPVIIEEECVGFAINFTTNSTIPLPKHEEQTIYVSIIAAMYNATDIEERAGAVIKTNVTISDWPWKSDENKLAMETYFTYNITLPENKTVDLKTFDRDDNRELNIMIDGQPVAFLRFLKQAFNGTHVINVNHNFTITDEGNGFKIWTCYDHFQGTLVDDPSFGVFEEALSSIRNLLYPLLNRYVFAGAVLATIVVFAVAYKIRRKEIFRLPAYV